MGTWGIGLYDNDDTLDLREDFKAVVRACLPRLSSLGGRRTVYDSTP
jgi:hypothetical protein